MDAEKSYDDWVANNLSFIAQHKNMIGAMKKIYIDGFNDCYMLVMKNKAEEQLQK